MSPSPIRCRGPWKIHKRLSEPDRWLDEMGFFRKHTARDSSCLFRAVSENIYNTQRYYHKVRLECVQFMASSRHLFEGSLSCPFENYLKEMSSPSEYGGLVEISAMSHCYRRDFVIFEANKGPQTKICNGYGDTIYLFYSSDTKHFDAVYTKEFINASSFCQLQSTVNNALVYEILYDGVYQLKDLPHAVDKMLHDKISTNHNEYFMLENVERRKKQKETAKIFIEPPKDDKDKNNNTLALKCKHHTEDLERASLLKESLSIFVLNRSLIQLENVCMNCLNVNSAKDLLENGITPFPYKVAKALDPDIYRNIEFDVWSELRREIRYGARYCDGTTLQVGVKCLCKLQSDQTVAYHCHIQEMRPDGPCLVFIEELGEKRVVNYEQLEPLPDDQIKPWAPPYRYSRGNSQIVNISQMLQQIGNISRKQGMKARSKSKSEERKFEEVKQSEEYCQPSQMFTYPHLDYMNFQPMPCTANTLMVNMDGKPGKGAAKLPSLPPRLINFEQHAEVDQTSPQVENLQETPVTPVTPSTVPQSEASPTSQATTCELEAETCSMLQPLEDFWPLFINGNAFSQNPNRYVISELIRGTTYFHNADGTGPIPQGPPLSSQQPMTDVDVGPNSHNSYSTTLPQVYGAAGYPAPGYPPPPLPYPPYAPLVPPYAPPYPPPPAQQQPCVETTLEQEMENLTLQNNRGQQKQQRQSVGPRFKRYDNFEGQNGNRSGQYNGQNSTNKGYGATNGGQWSQNGQVSRNGGQVSHNGGQTRNGGQGSRNNNGYRNNGQINRNNNGYKNNRRPPANAPAAPAARAPRPAPRPSPRPPRPAAPFPPYGPPPPVFRQPALQDPAIINSSPVQYYRYDDRVEPVMMQPFYAPPLSYPNHYGYQYHQQHQLFPQQQMQQYPPPPPQHQGPPQVPSYPVPPPQQQVPPQPPQQRR